MVALRYFLAVEILKATEVLTMCLWETLIVFGVLTPNWSSSNNDIISLKNIYETEGLWRVDKQSMKECFDLMRRETLIKMDKYNDKDSSPDVLMDINEHAAKDKKNINLLLLGTSGNGKSATGNSIVGKDVLQTSASLTSTQSTIGRCFVEFDNVIINIVDIPGIDTDNTEANVVASFQQFINDAFGKCEDGFTALVLVFKYGNRFSRQELETIKLIKATFGDDVIKNNVICLLTHGDHFRNDSPQVDFEAWCKQQEGNIKQFFQECDYRCVLFDNATSDKSKLREQRSLLLNLTSKTKVFTNESLHGAEGNREKLRYEMAAPEIIKKTNEFLDEQRKEIRSIEDLENDVSQQLNILRKVLNNLEEYEMKGCNPETFCGKALNPSILINVLKSEVESKIKLKELERRSGEEESKLPVDKQKKERRRRNYAQVEESIYANDISVPVKMSKETAIDNFEDNSSKRRKPLKKSILLIGTVGHGKSASGNSILNDNVFAVSNNSHARQHEIKNSTKDYGDVSLIVVDTPGIDTEDSQLEDLTTFQNYVKKAFEVSQGGFDALVLVLRFGDRFSTQERHTVTFIKRLFGETVVKNNIICLFTHGDVFDEITRTSHDEGLSFTSWYRQQKGELRELLDECQQRYVLFDNRTNDHNIIYNQVKQLMDTIERTNKYKEHLFHKAIDKQINIFMSIKEDNDTVTSHLIEIIEIINNENNSNTLQLLDKKREQLRKLSQENTLSQSSFSKLNKLILDHIQKLHSQNEELKNITTLKERAQDRKLNRSTELKRPPVDEHHRSSSPDRDREKKFKRNTPERGTTASTDSTKALLRKHKRNSSADRDEPTDSTLIRNTGRETINTKYQRDHEDETHSSNCCCELNNCVIL